MRALIVPELGANVLSVALNEKGVKLTLLREPPVLCFGGHHFTIRNNVPRMYKRDKVLNLEGKTHYISTDDVNL